MPRTTLTFVTAVALALVLATEAPAQKRTADDPAPRKTSQEDKEAGAAAGVACYAVALVFGAILYFVPSYVAMRRGHPNLAPIFVVNLFLGWMLIGWVAALAWSLTAQEPRPASKYQRQRRNYGHNPFE
jgi:hypothetical protein